MSIARGSAEVGTPVVSSPITPSSVFNYDGVPIDTYRYFDTSPEKLSNKEIETLRNISEWAFDKSETVGDAMVKIRNLEMRLGVPVSGESRFGKIHTWIKMQRQIEDIQKRQSSLGRI